MRRQTRSISKFKKTKTQGLVLAADNYCRWDGPVEEKTPPYNIMSTAKPRGEEEERKFTLQAATFETS